ncbi:MAG: relaxase domain-containing protein [Phycisphaerae bacterium]|nr:MAG: relaxase domain-containing protein [Phycisphaerae bacterium]MBE7457816.1 relaxase domain-containing protein [Planctomycetia bacterium]MCL4720212.1 relaxase domain-containing protein [Phycisphaerae bacterium]
MLRIIQNNSPDGAKSYFSTADYYSEGQELVGLWRGEGAKRLGLGGVIQQKQWDALCDNLDPWSNRPLTARTKQDRRVGFDFTFNVPKSVSVLYALTKDRRIVDAIRDTVDATMEDIEPEMQTRVRKGGRNEDRVTGNMVYGQYLHTTGRPVDGVPDPQLHVHCFVFNATWDEQESRWKAGQFAGIKRDAPFFEAVFRSRLARRIEELGMPVERTKEAWDLAGVPASVVARFSRRTAQIEKLAKELGITDPDAKGELGAKTRERKQKDLRFDDLCALWKSWMSDEELRAMAEVRSRMGDDRIAEDDRVVEEAVRHASEHCFERASVVPERKLLTVALKQSFGSASPESVIAAVGRQGLISAERDGRRLVTTRAVLAEERRMLDFAREGRGACRQLGIGTHVFARDWLNADQRRAVEHVLTSHDRVMLIRGAAGTGKTTMMKEAVEAIESNGRRVFVFAPSADASRFVLREKEGFAGADTVARLLRDERMQRTMQGQVLWIDEAGLLGTKSMREVFDLADRLDARVILSGDRRQHGSVERGAALRLLEEEAGLVPANIREIQRQDGEYREAVRALSEGRTEEGFRRLDDLGWIREVPETERYKLLAADYVAAIREDKSDDAALVVSPTHLEGEWITDEIRARLKELGELGPGERRLNVLENANLTEGERRDPLNYAVGDVLVFHQNAKGFRKGQRVVVGSEPLPLDQADKFQVFRPGILPVAPGDKLRITRNGKTADERGDLNNGTLCTVAGFTPKGDIRLTNGKTIGRDYGHLAHGYVVTSHASQGKTVKRVFIGQSSQSFPASSREQFYVSVSRGRKGVTVYTDDKESLLEAVSHSDDRITATELVGTGALRERAQHLHRLESLMPVMPVPEYEREGMIHER